MFGKQSGDMERIPKIMISDVIIDVLSIPNWFIVDFCIVNEIAINDGMVKGFEWRTWRMPNEYCKDMEKLKKEKRIRHG